MRTDRQTDGRTDGRTDGHPKPRGPQPFGLGPKKKPVFDLITSKYDNIIIAMYLIKK